MAYCVLPELTLPKLGEGDWIEFIYYVEPFSIGKDVRKEESSEMKM